MKAPKPTHPPQENTKDDSSDVEKVRQDKLGPPPEPKPESPSDKEDEEAEAEKGHS